MSRDDQSVIIIEAIRLMRKDGEPLGNLVDKFGAEMVVAALGVRGVAQILGVDERTDDDYDE